MLEMLSSSFWYSVEKEVLFAAEFENANKIHCA
jgi:hypothetical protein